MNDALNNLVVGVYKDGGSKISDGEYRNTDLDPSLFVKVNEDTITLSKFDDLRENKINDGIYFSPSNYPRVNRHDYTLGSCFDGWLIPPPSYSFTKANGNILVERVNFPRLSLHDYLQYLKTSLKFTLTEIYALNKPACLLYSGGIDSVILLSIIDDLGYLDRTSLVFIDNATSDLGKKRTLATEPNVQKHFDILVGKFLSAHKLTIDVFDLSDLLLTEEYETFVTYCTTMVAKTFNPAALISGAYGNAITLHQGRAYLETLAYGQPADIGPTYCRNLVNLKDDKLRLSESYLQESRTWPDRYRGTNYYHPFGNLEHFGYVRGLDYSSIAPSFISSAEFAFSIIDGFADGQYRQFASVESPGQYDSLNSDIQIPVTDAHISALTIHDSVTHSEHGLDYLRGEIARASETGMISINSAVAIKAIQSHLRKCSNAIL